MKNINSKRKASPWGSSLKYLKWDRNHELNKEQKLISETVHEWYDAKHRQTSSK